MLRIAKTAMPDISGLDDAYEALRARIESMFYEVEDIGLELRAAIEALEADEGALQQAAERLDKLKRLSPPMNYRRNCSVYRKSFLNLSRWTTC